MGDDTISIYEEDMATPIISWTGAIDRTFGGFGFSAATGGSLARHIVDSVEVSYGAPQDNQIVGNDIENNNQGIALQSTSGNFIYHNNFLTNTVQAQDDWSNTWDNGYPSGGNYWSDYGGADTFSGPLQNIPGSDGFGDTAYVIDGDSQDNYPLMQQTTSSYIYDISASGNTWNIEIYDITKSNQIMCVGPIAPGESGKFVVRVYIPLLSLLGDTDTVIVTTLSQCDLSLHNTLTLSTEVIESIVMGGSSGETQVINDIVPEEESIIEEATEPITDEVLEPIEEVVEVTEPVPSQVDNEATQPINDDKGEANLNKHGFSWMWTLLPTFLFITLVPSTYLYRKKKR